jgi:Asp-tRNA(Asn)/Glu-tRNA(Gln) amidotransferase B subunit
MVPQVASLFVTNYLKASVYCPLPHARVQVTLIYPYYKHVLHIVQHTITGYLNTAKRTILDSSLTPEGLAEMIALIKSGKITGKICKELLPELLDTPLTGKPLSTLQLSIFCTQTALV